MKKKSVNSDVSRPPIVSLLGHVDHGKTTLLDAIRKSNVAQKEAGGITQSIGASLITTKSGKKITFVDTPGHAVFTKMRLMGTKVADIAILVVAGDDGVKPQTKEAINYIKEVGISFIVAFTKIDLPSASVEKVKSQLAQESVLLQGQGGDVPHVSVSAKKGEGLEDLVELISLVGELNEIKADVDAPLDAVVIETQKSKQGPLVSIVVRNGRLRIGDEVRSTDNIEEGAVSAKIRGLVDHQGKAMDEVLPGEPAQVLGFAVLPEVGSKIVFGKQEESPKESATGKQVQIEEGQMPVVIKTGSAGSLDAIIAHLPEEVAVVSSGIGDVSESDVFIAKSSEAHIFAFESKVPTRVVKLARTEGIDIEEFKIVYKLFERLEEILQKGKVKVLGRAEVLAEFPFNKQRVAGSKVIEGRINKSDSLILMRGDKEIGRTKVGSMRKEKKDVDIVKSGEEFGLILSPYLDFQTGDVVVSVRN